MAFVILGEAGVRGGSRTHMWKNPRRILSPQRLPFRHPGSGITNLANGGAYCNICSIGILLRKRNLQRTAEHTLGASGSLVPVADFPHRGDCVVLPRSTVTDAGGSV